MGDTEKDANIPLNYVTLLQLQERWMKAQQRKQNQKLPGQEKEEQEPQQNEQEKVPVQTIKGRRREPHENDRRDIISSALGDSFKKTHRPTSEVTGRESADAKKRNMKKKQYKNAEARPPEKEETSGDETRARPIMSYKMTDPARKYGKTRGTWIEKAGGVVKQSDLAAVVERKTENLTEGSDGMVEVNRKFGELTIGKNKFGAYKRNRVFNRSKYEYRGGYGRGFGNRNDRGYGGYNRSFNGVPRPYYGGHYNNGRGRGRFNGGRGEGRMWVRKEEAVDDGGVSESVGSGTLLKEEE